jgi:hypothetical protein
MVADNDHDRDVERQSERATADKSRSASTT